LAQSLHPDFFNKTTVIKVFWGFLVLNRIVERGVEIFGKRKWWESGNDKGHNLCPDKCDKYYISPKKVCIYIYICWFGAQEAFIIIVKVSTKIFSCTTVFKPCFFRIPNMNRNKKLKKQHLFQIEILCNIIRVNRKLLIACDFTILRSVFAFCMDRQIA